MTTRDANISVVIPCFNNAASIERALRSVAAQTLRPFEVLVVDDASTDESREIVRHFATQSDLDLRLIALPINSGPSRARNTGWDQARGQYVAFLDSDDVWHPQKLEMQYGVMAADPTAVISGHPFEVTIIGEEPFRPVHQVRARPYSARTMLLKNRYPTPSVMLLRTIPQRFDDTLRYSEDYLLWLQILLSGGKGLLIDQPLFRMFKPAYGAQGLSSHLHRMQHAELQVYATLRRQKAISTRDFTLFCSVSILKYLRRVMVSRARKA